jgi:hypothetical protein
MLELELGLGLGLSCSGAVSDVAGTREWEACWLKLRDGWMPGSGKVVVEEVSGLPKMFWEITMS